MRRPPKAFVVGASVVVVLWVVVALVAAPALIRLGYSGSAGALLSGLFSDQVAVDAYLASWYALARAASLALALLVAVTVVAYGLPAATSAVLGRLLGGKESLSPREVLVCSALLGMAGGAAEAIYTSLRQLATHRPAAGYYWEILWMAPISSTLAALFVAVVLLGVASVGRVRIGIWKVTAVFGFCLAYGVLRREGIAIFPVAAVILGLGIASALAGAAEARAAAVRAAIRRAPPYLLVALGLLVALAVAQSPSVSEWRRAAGRPQGEGSLPNIVLIVLDTVRAASLSLYGYGPETTPNLDDWSSEGTVFDRAYATAPWTLPTHATLFTGRYAHETGTGVSEPLDDRFPTLAETLRAQGYATGGFAANLIYTTEMSGLQRGFERYEAGLVDVGRFLNSSFLPEFLTRPLARRTALVRVRLKDATTVSDQFLRWSESRGEQPYFAFLNYYDAHEPYQPPLGLRDRFGPQPTYSWDTFKAEWTGAPTPAVEDELRRWENQYDGAIAYLDQELGRIRSALDERGDLGSTLVVVVSDHGEMWGELGQISHPHSLYLPLLHVPLFVSFPGRVPAGVRIGTEVSLRDVPATVLDLAGLAGSSRLPGRSLRSTWEAPGHATGSPLLAELEPLVFIPDWGPVRHGPMSTLFEDGVQYVLNGNGTEELYDHRAGPSVTDVAADPAWAPTLDRLRAHLDSVR